MPWHLLRGTRTRILASYLILLAGFTVLSDLALREALLSRVDQRVDRALEQEVQEFRRLVRAGREPRTGRPLGSNVGGIFDLFLTRNVPSEGEAFYTFVGGKSYKATDPSLGRELLHAVDVGRRTTEVTRDTIETRSGDLRFIRVPVLVSGRQRGLFVMTAALGEEREEVTDALQIALVTSLGVLLLASAIAFWVAGRVLAPLRGLRDTARMISETDLTSRIPAEGKDEIADLAHTFNSMLDRLEEAFASQKDFISDAGHELRTPITIIRGHLELLGEEAPERRETVELVTDELDRMSRFVDDLLVLAKVGQPDFLRFEPLDLDLFAEELWRKSEALAPRDWRLDARGGAGRVMADRQRLTQAVMNLATNAARHTDEGATIEIGASLRDGSASLWVRDSGPGVAEADRERIFERFEQGTAAPDGAEGTGLGLAIARAIAEAHGGRLELESIEGAGSRFTVNIPAERPGE